MLLFDRFISIFVRIFPSIIRYRIAIFFVGFAFISAFFLGGAISSDGLFGSVTAVWVQALGAVGALLLAVWLPRHERNQRKRELQVATIVSAQLAVNFMIPPAMFLKDKKSRQILLATGGLPGHAFKIADEALAAVPTVELADAVAIEVIAGLRGALGTLQRLGESILQQEAKGADLTKSFAALWHATDQAKEDLIRLGKVYGLPVSIPEIDMEEFTRQVKAEAVSKGWPGATPQL